MRVRVCQGDEIDVRGVRMRRHTATVVGEEGRRSWRKAAVASVSLYTARLADDRSIDRPGAGLTYTTLTHCGTPFPNTRTGAAGRCLPPSPLHRLSKRSLAHCALTAEEANTLRQASQPEQDRMVELHETLVQAEALRARTR